MINRRRVGLPQRELTFNDFVELEYIENISDAYIDTNIKGHDKVSIDCKIMFTKMDDRNQFIAGNRNRNDATTASSNYAYAYFIWSDGRFGSAIRSSWPSYADYHAQANVEYRIKGAASHPFVYYSEIDEETQEVVEKQIDWTNSANTSGTYSRNMFLFNIHQPTHNKVYALRGRLYYCKIYVKGTLERDFIPVMQKYTGICGLWDKVHNIFYISPNTVRFVGGPVKVSGGGNALIINLLWGFSLERRAA